MVNFGRNYILRKVFILFVLIYCFCFLVSCQTVKPTGNTEMRNLANEIEQANQKIEEIYHRVSVVQFMVDNHERTITDLEKKLKKARGEEIPYNSLVEKEKQVDTSIVISDKSATKTLLTPEAKADIPKPVKEESEQYQSPEYIYNQGFAALKAKNYTKAISMFKTIVSTYPEHNLADNAIYWTGEIHYTQHDFPEAVRTFNRLIEKYPEGGKVVDALLKIGYSYYSMKDNENAVKYLKKVVVDYPFTVSGSKAEAMLNKIE